LLTTAIPDNGLQLYRRPTSYVVRSAIQLLQSWPGHDCNSWASC